MSRATQWLRKNVHTPRVLIWSGVGGSVVLGYGFHLKSRRPFLLDSEHNADAPSSPGHKYSSATFFSQRFNRVPAASTQLDQDDNKNTSTTQRPPSQTKHQATAEDEFPDETSPLDAWRKATASICAVCETFSGFDFSGFRAKITSLLIPAWMRLLPNLLEKLQNELSMAPWSLSWEIWEDAHDPEINPEILWSAQVRISQDLCAEERDFLRKRRVQTAKALAKYLNVPESEVHPEDVPTIAMCGSGGGLRALVAGASSYLSAQETGLFDCVTYTAGVSGSCWLQTLYYSSLGQLSHERVIDHLKQRIGVHIAYPPAALQLLDQAPTNKFLLSGLVQKLRGEPDADFGLVDIYGLLLAARLLVPNHELRVSDYDLKISNQRWYTDDGHQPLPIYTAVRHEIPIPSGESKSASAKAKEIELMAKHYDWFQWFEWTPYEFFCEELDAGIPTWALGRRFNAGQNQMRDNGLALPELRVPLMLGIWGSAFCATLSHYYKELRPTIMTAGLDRLDSLLAQKDDDLVKVHPIDPATIPNFLLGLRGKLSPSCPESIHTSDYLQLMDAGMSNNLPIYPLLRRGRDVDIIIAFDASADVQTDNWLRVVDGYVRQRNIKGWPMGAGWPPSNGSSPDVQQDIDDMTAAQAASSTHSRETVEAVQDHQQSQDNASAQSPDADLGHCTVWVGTVQERHEYMDEPPSHRLPFTPTNHPASDPNSESDSDTESPPSPLSSPNAGITVIYFPFTANPAVPGVDPMQSDFMSTWNFVYKPHEIDQVVALARANFHEGQEQTKRAIRAVWLRKRALRREREQREREFLRAERGRRGRAAAWRNGDVGHGDQFGGGV